MYGYPDGTMGSKLCNSCIAVPNSCVEYSVVPIHILCMFFVLDRDDGSLPSDCDYSHQMTRPSYYTQPP